ncbi:MAG: hypothetical protein RIS25_984 [Actinomycetota bacterium]
MNSTETNPYLISVADVSHRTGEEVQLTLDFPVPEQLGEGMAKVLAGTPMTFGVRLDGLHDGVLVWGNVETSAAAECVRCLDEVQIPVRVDFQEVFAYSPTEEFDYSVHENHVNCEPVVRDAVVLSLPFQPLCDEDCLGLDPETGEKLTEPRAEQDAPIDPRWAALQALNIEKTGE